MGITPLVIGTPRSLVHLVWLQIFVRSLKNTEDRKVCTSPTAEVEISVLGSGKYFHYRTLGSSDHRGRGNTIHALQFWQ